MARRYGNIENTISIHQYHTLMRRRSRMARPRNPIQSFKQIQQIAPASIAAGTIINGTMAQGLDNYTGPSANNSEVPTGAVITGIDIQLSFQNLVNIAGFLWVSIQHLRSGQTAIDARAAGGDPQRNQVHLQLVRCIGQNQNVNVPIKFKVPKKFQRVRDGDKWIIQYQSDQIMTATRQIIYKFYR